MNLLLSLAIALTSPLDTATFAGGCFWSLERAFDQVPGVVVVAGARAAVREAHHHRPAPRHHVLPGGGVSPALLQEESRELRPVSRGMWPRPALEGVLGKGRGEHVRDQGE